MTDFCPNVPPSPLLEFAIVTFPFIKCHTYPKKEAVTAKHIIISQPEDMHCIPYFVFIVKECMLICVMICVPVTLQTAKA